MNTQDNTFSELHNLFEYVDEHDSQLRKEMNHIRDYIEERENEIELVKEQNEAITKNNNRRYMQLNRENCALRRAIYHQDEEYNEMFECLSNKCEIYRTEIELLCDKNLDMYLRLSSIDETLRSLKNEIDMNKTQIIEVKNILDIVRESVYQLISGLYTHSTEYCRYFTAMLYNDHIPDMTIIENMRKIDKYPTTLEGTKIDHLEERVTKLEEMI